MSAGVTLGRVVECLGWSALLADAGSDRWVSGRADRPSAVMEPAGNRTGIAESSVGWDARGLGGEAHHGCSVGKGDILRSGRVRRVAGRVALVDVGGGGGVDRHG